MQAPAYVEEEDARKLRPVFVGVRKDISTRFQPGQPGNTSPRLAGYKHAIGKDFLRAVAKHVIKNGKPALDRLAREKPDKYCELIASLIPQEATVLNVHSTANLSPDTQRLSEVLGFFAERIAEETRYRSLRDNEGSMPDGPLLPDSLRTETA